MQVMPGIFDQIEELRLVDWMTIAIYTCSNPECVPNFDKEEFYEEEFAYIQFSDDFKSVKYGDETQMVEQKRLKKEEMLKMIEEECANDPEFQIIKSDAIAESEANPDKKKKKKNKN